MAKYLIVLFKDKKRKKIINKFLTRKKAEDFYTNYLIENENVIFEKQNQFGKESKFEVGLLELGKSPDKKVYFKDDFGRAKEVKIEGENLSIIRIDFVRIEEKIFDLSNKKKIGVQELVRRYLSGPEIKMISGLNNKIIVQKDDKINLFLLKNVDDAERLLDTLQNYFIKIKKVDCLIVKDSSKTQKKYLYDILKTNGFDKQFLYRKFTVAPRPK